MDGETGGQRTIVEPEGYLRSALEKIVFFECRVSQLEAELSAARTVAERARGDAAAAHRKAVELEQALAGERGARADAERHASEREERVRLLEAERERLLSGLVDRARVSGAARAGALDEDDGQADLAGFIAELRAEIDALRAFKAAVEASPLAQGMAARREPVEGRAEVAPRGDHPSLSALAGRFERDGRMGLGGADADRMKDLLTTRADRALYERSMDDLASSDAGRRLRAVRALEALGSRAAAPLLAATLGREEDDEVKSALLAALARFKEPFAAEFAERALGDASPAVRVAALEALAAIAAGAAEEKLARALGDASPLVRRRAALLLGFQTGERAEEALAIALADENRGVARAAAAALSGRPSARAQEALARGLEHPDGSVRRATALALSRLSGERIDAEGPPSARRAASRRIAERLAAMDGDEIRQAVLRSTPTASATAEPVRAATAAPPRAAPPPAPAPPALPSPAPRASPGVAAPAIRSAARSAVAVLSSGDEDAPGPGASDLEPRLVAEIRAALRGCTAEGLAGALGAPHARIDSALQALALRGTVAQRGTRWFMS